MQCVFLLFFAIRFILFIIMISRFIDVLANVRIYFFRLNNIPLCMLCICVCVCVCVYHILSCILYAFTTTNRKFLSKSLLWINFQRTEKYCNSLGLQTFFSLYGQKSHGILIFFFRNLHTILNICCTNLYSKQQYTSFVKWYRACHEGTIKGCMLRS